MEARYENFYMSEVKMNKVSIIIPTVRTKVEIAGLISEIKNTVYYDLDLIVMSGMRVMSVNSNMGLDKAKSEFIIMCDDDTEGYQKGWDKTLLDMLEKLEPEGATIVGARLLNLDGTLNRVNYHNYDLSVEYSQTRTMITPCCAFRNTKLRFDENYKGWGWNDTDWCKQLGGKSFVVNTVRVIHRNEEKNPLGSEKQIAESRAYFRKKWGTKR